MRSFRRHLLDSLGEVKIVKTGIGRAEPLRRDGVDDGAAEFGGQPRVVRPTIDFRRSIRNNETRLIPIRHSRMLVTDTDTFWN